MQVACDHCGAEYELDESEITGRGVRITCPSCSHVFVVYQPKKEESFEIEVDLQLDDNGELSMDLDEMLGAVIADVEQDVDTPEQAPQAESLHQNRLFQRHPLKIRSRHNLTLPCLKRVWMKVSAPIETESQRRSRVSRCLL